MSEKKDRDIFNEIHQERDFFNNAKIHSYWTRQYLQNININEPRNERIDDKSFVDVYIELISLLGYILKKEGKKEEAEYVEGKLSELQTLYTRVFGDIVRGDMEKEYYT